MKKAPVKHLDETGIRVDKKLHWLHVACTKFLTFYRAPTKRGDMMVDLEGILVHDFWKSYFKIENVQHALCNAHLLRELKALAEIEKENWAIKMAKLLCLARKCKEKAVERGKTVLNADILGRLNGFYERIVETGLRYHANLPNFNAKNGKKGRVKHRVGHNLLLRLRDYRQDILRFMHDFSVPFTNNAAELDIRMMKVKQKISGCFRTEQGAKNFCTMRAVLSTARKQGWNLLETLKMPTQDLIQTLKIA